MDLQLLERTLTDLSQPPFRASQVWRWLARGAQSFDQMSDLPSELRQLLAEHVPISCLALQREARSSDGTIKALLLTSDQRPVEAVLMRYRDGRRSICLSSQSGCPLTCTFCATGTMPFGRNLTASEILDQALALRALASPPHRQDFDERPQGRALRGAAQLAPQGEGLTNCVFMGMGEPMMNLDAVLSACQRLPDLRISHRHTTISTVGWIPGIEALADQPMPLRLALSLHAADESLRSELMPVNQRYPLSDVLQACKRFYLAKRRRIFVEYVMLAGVNDRYQQALSLAKLLRAVAGEREQSIFKVNLIPYNPTLTPAGLKGSSREAIAAFKSVLVAHQVPVTVRLTRGRDIDAACGQLAAKAA